jgi:Tetratricopeptide repeat
VRAGNFATALGPEHPHTAMGLNYLGTMLEGVGELASAQPLYERAWVINEKVPVPTSLVCFGPSDLAGAQPLCERALAIKQKVHGPAHPGIA